MRQLATIQKIADVQPIEGADSIEKVKVKEWWCVAKKGEFKVDDPCVYFEIDSLLPLTNPVFEFLGKGSKPKKVEADGKTYEGYRLKTIRLRGQISQGLALPLRMFGNPTVIEYGLDLSEELGVVKYELPIPAQLSGKVKGSRPAFIPKTDEERVQNIAFLVEKYQDQEFYVTEKLDGSSATYYKLNGEFGVCSRNLELLETEGNSFWKVARMLKLPELLPDGYVLQGELVGEGVQNNPLKLKGVDVYFYNVFQISDSRYLDFRDFKFFIERLGLKTVPILEESWKLSGNVESLLAYAEGKSVISPESEREGVVFRPLQEKLETIQGVLRRFSFKTISNNYLLNERT